MEPDIYNHFGYYIEAFKELSTCRNNGLSLSPISFTAIKEYFTLYAGEESFEEFLYYIRSMDNELLSLDAKKRKSEKEKSK